MRLDFTGDLLSKVEEYERAVLPFQNVSGATLLSAMNVGMVLNMMNTERVKEWHDCRTEVFTSLAQRPQEHTRWPLKNNSNPGIQAEDTIPRTAHVFRVCLVACTFRRMYSARSQDALCGREGNHLKAQPGLHPHVLPGHSDGHSAPHCAQPRSEPQILRGVRLAIRPNYFPPQVMSPTGTTRTTLQTFTCASPATRCKVQQPVMRPKMSQRLSSRKAYI